MYCFLKWIKFSVKQTNTKKNTGKLEKILEKSGKSQGNLSVRKSGNPARISQSGLPTPKGRGEQPCQYWHNAKLEIKAHKL